MSNQASNNKASRFAALRAKFMESSSPKFNNKDAEGYWKVETSKEGNGSAVLRFLNAKSGEEYPYIQVFSHGFQGPSGKWYIEQCPTSINEDCPVCKANSALWAEGSEASKKLVSARKRKKSFVSNVLIVNDPKHPENNGKVMLYKYGQKIFEKLKDLIAPPPDFADLEPIDPFDSREGANFKLRVTRQDNFPNYDKSSFDGVSAIGNEDRIAEVDSQLHSLNALLEESNFKPYDELQKRLALVVPADADQTADTTDGDEDDMPILKPKTAPKTQPKPQARVAAAPKSEDVTSDDYLAKLVAES